MTLIPGAKAPDFTLPRDGGQDITLSALTGGPVILYFYPKDDTSGCTLEAQDFTAAISDFEKLGARVFGISRDSLKRHENFVRKYELGVALLSDEDGSVCEAYGTWIEKKMYGRAFMGIERATFLINGNGEIARIWRKVKVKGHVAEVLEATREIA